MEFKDREREFLEKPRYYGAPLGHLDGYFKGMLEAFRELHPDFDAYLKEIARLLEKKGEKDLGNVLRFVKGDVLPNWVSPNRGSLFAFFIKTYNYCLSPNQTVDHILKCLKLHRKMLSKPLTLVGKIEIITERSSFDGEAHKFIKACLEPASKAKEEAVYRYEVKLPEIVLLDGLNPIDHVSDIDFAIKQGREIHEDVLSLFEYHQGGRLLKRLFEEGVDALKQREIIEGEETKEGPYGKVLLYKIGKDVGQY
ncbi:MAG: hypothetical protein K6B65_00065 [Bacilli bacterium]|nr:hypothetical protein [Bacilli bacterium]